MVRKAFSLTLFPLLFAFLLHPAVSFSQNTEKPYVSLSYYERGVNGVVEFSSVQEVKLQARSSANNPGAAKLEIYQASLDDLLQYLVHDDKYQQIYPKVDVSKLTHLSDLELNLTKNNQDVSLPVASTGIFFVRLKMNDLSSETYVIRSPFGTIAREAKNSLVLWTQDFSTQKSLSGGGKATLYSLEKQKSVIGTANLDGDGIASLPLSKNADVAVVENQGFSSVVPLNARYLNSSYFWTTFKENNIKRRFFIFTDRPIYKPGDTVRFKAIVRDDDDARYSMPGGSVNVEVTPGYERKNFVYKNTLGVDVNGFISATFTIPKTASTGEYRIKLNPDDVGEYEWDDSGNGDSLYFKVENYRKPEYFINAESPQVDVVRGDTVDIKINGEYYSGQPLANAVINYRIYSNDYGYYDSEYYFPDNGNHYYRLWNGNDVDSGTITLDSKGRSKITLPTNKNDSVGKHQVYFFEFSYQDDTGNPSTTGVNVFVRSGEYSLYRDGYSGYGGKPNEKISLPLVLKANRQGVSLSQKVDAVVTRTWWEETRDPGSKYSHYSSKTEEVGKYSFTTDSSGKSVFNITPQKTGSYEIKTEITDSRGNKITKSFYLWVNDQYSYYNYDGGETNSIRITPDKKSYRPGDIALVTINSTVANRDVFLAVERGYQDRYQVVHLDGNQKTVDIKILDQDLPNIYLTAKTFDTDSLAGDVQNVTIDSSGKKAYFTVSADKQNYAPGDDVIVNISAKDSSGNPLETNFAIWSVDKAIFALTDKNYGDVFERFWNNRYNNTTEANSLEGIMVSPAAEKGGCFLPGTKIKMGDGSTKSIEDVKPGDQVLTRLSDDTSKLVKTTVSATHQTSVPDYLIINKTLRVTGNHLIFVDQHWRQAGLLQIGDNLTDIDGNQIKVSSIERLRGQTAVYNLTTDRYHTYFADNLYVHNQKGEAPRDNFSDTAYWNVSVNTNSQGQAQVKFKLPDNLTTWVITALGASVDTKVGEAFTEIKVNKDLVIRPALPNILSAGDLITVTALVNNFTDLDSQATVSLKTDAGQVVSPLVQSVKILPNDFSSVSWQIKVGNPGNAKLEFSVKDNHNRSDSIIQKIDIRSPGYWQQSSEFKTGSTNFSVSKPSQGFDSQKTSLKLSLSSSVLGSLPSAMRYLINYPYGCTEQTSSSLLAKIIAKKYPAAFAEAIKKDSGLYTIDDGVAKLASLQNYDGGWPWWWGGSESFVTAHVYRLLNEARRVGVNFDDSLLDSAQNYLQANFDNDTLENKVAKAYGLSFSADSKLHKSVNQDLDKLDADYLAMAVIANIASGQSDPSQNGLNLLLSRAQITTGSAYWPAGKTARFGSVETSTALAIQALVKSNSHLAEAAKAINYLMKNRHYDYWASTYATAQTILAITDYSQLQKESETNQTYAVSLGGKTLTTGKFVGYQSSPIEIDIDPSKIPQSGELSLVTSGTGELYSTLTQKWWLTDPSGAKASHGVTVTKKIINHKGEEYNLTPGDLVDVIINVEFDQKTANTDGYAVIEDHLPSGLIPVNTHLNNESVDANSYYENYSREYLTDGIIIPVYYGKQNTVYSYQARVISAGTFNVPPAYFAMMYYPEVWSRSDSSTIEVASQVKINPLIQAQKAIPAATAQAKSFIRQFIIPIIFVVVSGLIVFVVTVYVNKKKLN